MPPQQTTLKKKQQLHAHADSNLPMKNEEKSERRTKYPTIQVYPDQPSPHSTVYNREDE
jgi:hypothetical protein